MGRTGGPVSPHYWTVIKSTTMRLFVSHHSVLRTTTRGPAFIIIIQYCGYSGSSANSNSPSLGISNVWKDSRMFIISQSHSKNSHGSNTFPTPSQKSVVLRDTILYHSDRLAADDRSRKTAQTLNANQVERMRLMMLPCGGFR